jgi:hypothetical protein
MNLRWMVFVVACSVVVLCGAGLASAAPPTVSHYQPAISGPARVVQAARPAPATAPDAPAPGPACPCVQPPPSLPPPCWCDFGPWPQSLLEFASE